MLGPRSEKYKKDVIAGFKTSQFCTHYESWGIPLLSNEIQENQQISFAVSSTEKVDSSTDV